MYLICLFSILQILSIIFVIVYYLFLQYEINTRHLRHSKNVEDGKAISNKYIANIDIESCIILSNVIIFILDSY